MVCPGCPSVLGDRYRAAAGFGRSAAFGKIHWYSVGSYPPVLRVCPSHLVVRGDKMRVVRDVSSASYPLNSVLGNPPVQYGATGALVRLLSPGECMGGVDLQDYFLRWLMAPTRRRYLGGTHPVSGVLGVYLFLPSGLGPAPEWNDKCVKAGWVAARLQFPQLRMVDFVSDIRLVGASGEHGALAAGMMGFTSLLDQIGVRYRAKQIKRWWPTRAIPWLGFVVDTMNGAGKMGERAAEEGLRLREALSGARLGSAVPAPGFLAPVSFLNFLHCVAPGGFCRLRSGRGGVNEPGAMDKGESGAKRASAHAAATEELRNEMLWRRRTPSPRPMKKLQFCETGGFARHPRLSNLRDLALSVGDSAVAAVYAEASSIRGWGATPGDRFIQGKWSRLGRREGVNWKELWVLRKALEA